MSTMQQALQDVGLEPTKTRQTIRRHNMARFGTEEKPTLATIVDAVFAPITKTRKIQVQRAGGFYRARYAGRPTTCFALTAEQAIKYLRFFDGGAQ